MTTAQNSHPKRMNPIKMEGWMEGQARHACCCQVQAVQAWACFMQVVVW